MNIPKEIQDLKEKLEGFKSKIPLNDYRIRLDQIDFMVNSNPSFWQDTDKATKLMKERKELEDKLNFVKSVEENISFYQEYQNLPEFQTEIVPELMNFKSQVEQFETGLLFDKPEDRLGAIVSINAGQGGEEGANWVFMLLRMYLRFCDRMGWKTEILDEHRSETNSSICIDNIIIKIEGEYAYGNFKSENGVHRLIRQSPFSSANARHTSFAAVQVLPDLDDEIEVKLDMKDVEITAQRSGGSGGQAVNKISSCARFHHIPTGIKFKVQTERDFHQNKATGIKMLKSKIYNLELEKRQKEEEKRLGQQSDNSFGSQIRTYTFTPYTLVSDHRTDVKITDVQSVMDGKLEELVRSYLQR